MALAARWLFGFLFFLRRHGRRGQLLREASDLLGGELSFDLRQACSLSLLIPVEQDQCQNCRTEYVGQENLSHACPLFRTCVRVGRQWSYLSVTGFQSGLTP
ncbi:hypothetical protein ASD08_18460 [Streptomyces sp. Root369]|nr:hypothetical protein ASD08_18460 [Streptomyces sp. Root369]